MKNGEASHIVKSELDFCGLVRIESLFRMRYEKKTSLVFGIILVLLMVAPVQVRAQVGVGAEIPLTAFVSMRFTESFLCQLGVPIGAIGGFTPLVFVPACKLYFDGFEFQSLLFRPYLGGGAGIVAALQSPPSLFALGGLELVFPDTTISVYVEIGLAVMTGGLFTSAALGVRYEFGGY